MEIAKDPFTGETFHKRRSNQKFASRENQIRYNNRIAREKRKAKALVEQYLDKNRTILKTILGNEKVITKSRDFMLGAGFHFGCHTHSIQRGKELWKCVYDYAFLNIGNNQYKIVKHA
ncbi:MAG: hypothetical protein AAF934_12000 [Bacteroidota bacterium]